jgi:PUB domain
LKTLKVVLNNLIDPVKQDNPKYRTLNLSNPKLMETLWNGIPYLATEWFQQTLGFVVEIKEGSADDTPTQFLVLPPSPPSSSSTSRLLQQSMYQTLHTNLETALRLVDIDNNDTSAAAAVSVESSHKKAKRQQHDEEPPPPLESLTEKQKARRLLEQAKARDQAKAKEERARQIALLQQDKHTRIHDPNWKPGLSAACAKSGTSISTFRDKYGEN